MRSYFAAVSDSQFAADFGVAAAGSGTCFCAADDFG